MKYRGKNYRSVKEKIEKNRLYDTSSAITLLKSIASTKFDETVEVSMNLNLDVKKADQQLRGALVLPKGTGKSVKVLVVAKGDFASAAKKAGADYVGDLDILEKIEKENWFDFDMMIATPDMMPALGKLGKILGPKGLMPNPKTGTVTMTPGKVVEDVKKGMIEYRADSYGNVHAVIGKVSFDDNALIENFNYLINAIIKAKPTAVKGKYVTNITVSSTMGPGIKVDLNSFDK